MRSRPEELGVRSALAWLGSAAVVAGGFCVFFPLLCAWPTRTWRMRMATLYARAISRTALALAGIRVEVEHRERLQRVPAVFLFNHANEVDFFVNAGLAHARCLAWGKRELARVPLVGWVWLLSGHPLVKRGQPEQWARVLEDVTRRVGSGRFATLIAPEGRRSGDGRLQPFKKGAFHIALETGAPIVPVVVHGAAGRLVGRRLVPGTVRVEVLEAIETREWDPERLDAHVAEVRRVFLAALGQADADGEAARGGEATAPAVEVEARAAPEEGR